MRLYPFLLSLLLLPALLCAQGRNFSTAPAPAWLVPYQPDLTRRANLKEISEGYYQLLFEEQRHVEKQTVYRHIIRQIVSEAGIQNGSEITVEYDPSYEKLQFHQVVIRRNGQVINRLDPSKFKVLQQETELSMFIYSGIHSAYLIVEDVRKGDQIEYAYSIIGENPIYKNKFSHTFYFTAYEPIMNFYKTMLVSPSRQLSFKKINGSPEPEKRNYNGLVLYEWDLQDTVHITDDDRGNLPRWYTSYPHTQVSEFQNWKEVAEWGLQVSNIPLSGPEINARVASLKKQADGSKEKYLLAAIRFVQDDIRYMGIEMGEYSHQPNAPEKVCKQRFGDCKDKSLLLCALLRAVGIEADMAYVHTEYRDKIAGKLPSPDRFNHAITRIRLHDDTYWVDATASYQRGRLKDRYNPAYGLALVITDTTTSLSQIPVRKTGGIFAEENITLPDTRNGEAMLEVSTEYSGYHADNLRNLLAEQSRNSLQTSYRDFYSDLYGDAELEDSMSIADDEVENIIRVKERYRISNPWKADSLQPDLWVFNTSAHLLTDKIVSTDDSRTEPLGLPYPCNIKQYIHIKFPKKWSLADPPLSIKQAAYDLTFAPKVYENSVSLQYQLVTLRDHLRPDEITQYVRDMNKLQKLCGFRFTWKPGAVGKTVGGGLNWMVLGVAIACTALFIYGCRRFYRRSVPQVYPTQEPWDITRGMVVIGFFVVLYPLVMFATVLDMETFQNRYWINLYASNPGRNISVIQLLMLAEAVFAVFMLVLAGFVVLLFFRRRDLFPRTFSFLLIFSPAAMILDYVLTDLLQGGSYLALHNKDLVLPVVSAAFCVPYLLTSERSKHTFVVPYEEENGA
ncbi:DUF3857 domain-containing protein [Chitinophaga cymbidii]|uniref:DUF3857 domain-containing protein n=1 Tax=Chitinophaga cymbidii TaxID=1096750 RepID=A0A512RHQ0_9BACT|nr:DUF3857 domain-containing protein [Chitinophaga cymbidii]GEP95211.1 hypothetical protein CCY01nite_14710 [Chitinophaga cymbidii]